MWGLDLYKQGWVELATRKNPLPRAFHSAFVDSQQQMLLLGGVRDTQANPAPPDIFKLDLRAGKFVKLGDKDLVPGISSALSKGHHTSHFLSQNCDLVIFAPQKASTHLLGGNVTSEHCGRCTQIQPFTVSMDGDNDDTKSNTCKDEPLGTCRPATALLESHKSLDEFKSIGCNKRTLERLFVFGGYSPARRACTKQLYSLKFSSQPCKIANHQCNFTKTVILDQVPQNNIIEIKQNDSNQNDESDLNGDQETGLQLDKLANNRLSNVTPMRVSMRSRISPAQKQQAQPQTMLQAQDMNRQQNDDNQSTNINQSLMCTEQSFPQPQSKNNTARKIRPHRVSIVQTPVRAKRMQAENIGVFPMFESQHANVKINGLDPELVENHQRYKNDDAQQHEPQTNYLSQNQHPQRAHKKHKKLVHWKLIERLVLNFDDSLLEIGASFLLEPHEVITILHQALPLFEADATLTRIEGPVKVFGDIHGQLGDLMSLFKSFGYPDPDIGDIAHYKYVFLGDFVDRGHKSLEVICLLFSLKIEYPDRIFLIRGNHECHAMNEMYGFYHEIQDRLYPNIDTLKYLDNDLLNESIANNPLVDEELNEYFRRIRRNQQHRAQHRQQFSDMDDEDFLDIDLEYEEIEIENDENVSCLLEFDDDGNRIGGEKMKRRTIKKYKSRKYFRDASDCINYLVQSFELIFRWLPLGILIGDKILCVHGGIGELETLAEIESIERPCDVICDTQHEMNAQQRKIVDILWSDPAEKDSETGFRPNKRGVSCVFGSDVVRTFCKVNDIDLIIRGHQVVKDGYEYFAGGHLITVFSATNYCNVMDNAGAILCISETLRVIPKLVEPRPVQMTMQEQDNSDEEEDEEEESEDNLQWRKLKQFPPSPMRGQDEDEEQEHEHANEQNTTIKLNFDDMNEF